MNCLDFISESPRNYIFQKNANKTNFGGVITLLYLLTLIIISIIYIYDFYRNGEYEVNYLTINQFNLDQSEIKNDPDINPYKQFMFDLHSRQSNYNLSERFLLYDMKKYDFIPRNSIINQRVSDLDMAILYKCENIIENVCILNDSDYYDPSGYIIKTTFNGFRLLHNEEIPLQKDIINFTDYEYFSFNYPQFRVFIWQVIRYEEIKGLFKKIFDSLVLGKDEKEEYIDGYIPSTELFVIDNYKLRDINGTKYKIIYRIMMSNKYDKYIKYKRIRKGLFDVIGNICSFIPLLNFIFISLIFKFYSKNFDNYKIIERILENNKKCIKTIELSTYSTN